MKHDRRARLLRSATSEMNHSAEILGSYKATLATTTIPGAIGLMKKECSGLRKARVSVVHAETIIPEVESRLSRQLSVFDAAGIGLKSTATAAAASSGAYALVGLLGSASTGTAISGLSGAAAHGATMAWFGGGSLAAGGAGMAGGALVLGGLVALPAAILVGGLAIASNAEKSATEAYHKAAQLEVSSEELDSGIALVKAIKARVEEVYGFLFQLEARIELVCSSLKNARGRSRESREERASSVKLLADLVDAASDVMEAPIFDQRKKRVHPRVVKVLLTHRELVED